MADRPDDSDFTVAEEYADRIYDRFTGKDEGMVEDLDPGPYTETELDNFENFRFMAVNKLPTRDGAECQMCMLCDRTVPYRGHERGNRRGGQEQMPGVACGA